MIIRPTFEKERFSFVQPRIVTPDVRRGLIVFCNPRPAGETSVKMMILLTTL